MAILRTTLLILVSLGLMLAPLQADALMPLNHSAAPMNETVKAGPSTNKDCACCDLAARCPMATCAMHCVQFAPTSATPKDIAIIGHAAFAGLSRPLPKGLGWQPPPPPPRA